MTDNITAVILAGGAGSRMGGRRKPLLEVGGVRGVDRLLAVLGRVFSRVMVSVRQPEDYADLGVPLAEDRFDVRSSLTGIHAGLEAAETEHVFVCAGDAPFLREELVRAIVGQVRPERDVVIPLKEDGRMEPLCAVYSKRCLGHMARQLAEGDCKIIRFFPEVRVHTVPPEALRAADPGFDSFMNMNTPEELDAARAMMARPGQGGAV